MKSSINQNIDKYTLNSISFSAKEVLTDPLEIAIRWQKLNKALSLGNLYKTKIKIKFESRSGQVFVTEGTIWGLTDQNVLLKKHNIIPIRSIREVII